MGAVVSQFCQTQNVSEKVLRQLTNTILTEDSFVGVQRDTNYDMYVHEFLELSSDEEVALLADLRKVKVQSLSQSKESVML